MYDLQTLDSNKRNEALANASRKLGVSGPGKMLLFKASVDNGSWLLGQECTKINGQSILVLAGSFRKGYVAFEKSTNRKLDETSVSVWSDAKPSHDELDTLPNAKVSTQTSVSVYIPEYSTQAEMKGSTTGMEQAMDELLGQIVDVMQGGELLYCNPLIKLGVGSYQHKGGVSPTGQEIPSRKINIPVLTVEAWCDAEGNEKPTAVESRI